MKNYKRVTLVSNGHPLHEISIKSLVGYLEANGVPCRSLYLNATTQLTEEQSKQILDLCEGSMLVGFSLMSKDVNSLLPIVEALKVAGTPIVWGGIHATAMPEESLRYCNFACIGEGELTLLLLYQYLLEGKTDLSLIPNLAYSIDGKTILPQRFHSESSLDALPFPDYIFSDAYMLCVDGQIRRIPSTPDSREKFFGMSTFLFYSQRGCPFSCSYCSNSLYNTIAKKTHVRWYRTASPARVKAEIRHNLQFLKVRDLLWINDDDFISRPIEEIEEVGKYIHDELGLRFNINATPSAVTQEKMAILAKYGVHQIAMGVQTGSVRILKEVYQRRVLPGQVLKAANIISEFYKDGVISDYGFILENPYEQAEDYRDTISLFNALPKPFTVSLYSLAFFPSTILTNKALKENIITSNEISLNKDYRETIQPSFVHMLFEANYNFQIPKEINEILLRDIILKSDDAQYVRLLLSNYFISDAVKQIVGISPKVLDIHTTTVDSPADTEYETKEFIFTLKEIIKYWSVPSNVVNQVGMDEDLVLQYAKPLHNGTESMIEIGFSKGAVVRVGDKYFDPVLPANALNKTYRKNIRRTSKKRHSDTIKLSQQNMGSQITERPDVTTSNDSGWSFGIVTNGKRDVWVDELIETILEQNIQDIEIIVCGQYANTKKYSVNQIAFNGDDSKGWITKKKNMIIRNAVKDNICLLHDRMRLDSDWYRGIRLFGDDFDFQYCRTLSIDKSTEHNSLLAAFIDNGNIRICNVPHGYTRTGMWVDGGQIICKTKILKKNLLDEELFLGEGEDVEWCRRVQSKGYEFKFNHHSILLNVGNKKNVEKYEGSVQTFHHPSLFVELFKNMLISASHKWGFGVRNADEILVADAKIASATTEMYDEIKQFRKTAYNEPFYALWYGLILEHEKDYENALVQYQYACANGLNDSRVRQYILRTQNEIQTHSDRFQDEKNDYSSNTDRILGKRKTMEISADGNIKNDIRILYSELTVGTSQHLIDKIVHPVWKRTLADLGEMIKNGIPDNFLQNNICKQMFVRTGWQQQQDFELKYIKSLNKELFNRILTVKEPILGGIDLDCKELNISVNTLGMIWYYARIQELLKKNPRFVVEFGGGFGSLARLFRLMSQTAPTYIIIDLPEMLMLQYFYLSSTLGRSNINLIKNADDRIIQGKINLISIYLIEFMDFKADLFISTFALSETSQFTQDMICREKSFFKAKHLYITGQDKQEMTVHNWNSPQIISDSANTLFKTVKVNPFHIGFNYELMASDSRKSVKLPKALVLIFSKDRAMQLDATLRSFMLHCLDFHQVSVRIISKASNESFGEAYRILEQEYSSCSNISFIPENDFRTQVLDLLKSDEHVLFLVDDNIFVRDFNISDYQQSLENNQDALGYSLRLGKNTTYFYMLDKPQPLPIFVQITPDTLKYDWTSAIYDFGYPLEISSSLYRTKDMLHLLTSLLFHNPNSLESEMASQVSRFQKSHQYLLCSNTSVTFCNPINKVQNTYQQNRAGKSQELTADSLLVKSLEGQRIDVSAFDGFISNACHQEVTPTFIENANACPKVSVIIPCYKQAQYLHESVESIIKQTYQNYEIIIVNDGSPDNTSAVAKKLIEKYPNRNIRLLEKTNSGLSDARNYGIEHAKGNWILPLDSDDMIAKDFLKEAVRQLTANPEINLVFCNMQEFGVRNGEWKPGEYSRETILRWDTFPYCSLYKKDLWKKVNGYYAGIPWGSEDWNFWIASSKFKLKPFRIPEKYFLYRTTGTSMYDKMLPYFHEVKAFIKTLHTDLYGGAEMEEALQIIQNMSKESHEKLLAIIEKHPDLSMPYYWLSLFSRLNSGPERAAELLETSMNVAKKEGVKATERLHKLLEYQLPSNYSISQDQYPSTVDYNHDAKKTDFTPNVLRSDIQYGNKKHLTICVVASVGNIDPHGSNGGLETATIKTAESMADLGHSVAIVANGKTKEEVWNGVKYITFDNWKNKKYPEYLSKIDILAFASGPDLQSYNYVDNRIPKIVLFHHQHLEFIRGVDAKSLLNITANAVICVSRQVSSNLTGSGIVPSKLNVVHNGIDLGTFYPRAVERNPFKIMFVGALVPEKNPHLLIEVFLELEKKFKKVELHLYGSAALWGSVEYLDRQQINEKSTNIYFHGCVSQQELATAYSSSSFCVIPSAYESFSLVSLEAQACGCIPLAHNVGGISETMVHGKTGYLYTPNNAATLYQSLTVLLENISAVTIVRENAEKWVKENFSWKKTALQYQEIFYTVLNTVGDNHTNIAGMNIKRIESPLVTVVIPCYNYAQYLPEAVESVVRQTYANWEIIIVNDGSTDNTKKVAENLIKKYSEQKIKLINQANSGQPSVARNAGIAVAQGEFILPLDADDKIAPTFLEKTVAALKDTPNVGVAYTHIQHFGTLKSVYRCGTFCKETLVRDNILPYASLYRRRLWEEAGGYRTNVGYEDWDFWLTLVEKGVVGLLVPEPLFFYRKHGVSRLGADNDRRNQMVAQLFTNHPKLYSSTQVEEARKYLASLPGSNGTLSGVNGGSKYLSITYLISSILGVTGGNQTLLNQSNAMVRKGHSVTIVTYSDKPAFMQVLANVIKVPVGEPMSKYVPVSDVVVGTYFFNALELKNISAKVKIYFAQGDQFVFEDSSAKLSAAQKQQLREWKQLSKNSYCQTDVKFIANSLNLANAVENKYSRKADAIVPVCIDQTIFRPLQRSLLHTKPRILIVGPDMKGSAMEPLTFKGIGDIRKALELLSAKKKDFTAVRMSNSHPEIFKDFPCEFYVVPNDELKTFLYGTATILVYASHYDSCPIPPLEAMAAGSAVVCTASAGAKEYCRHEENCLLVPIQSPDELCNAIERLLDDTLLREKLIRGGFITAKQFPREREWNEMEQLFFRYMQEKQKGHGAPATIAGGELLKEIHTHLSNKQFTDVLYMINALPMDTKQTFNEEVLILQGCAHLGLQDLEKAKISFEHALKINQKSSEACSGLGEVFYLAEMDKESKTMFEWAVINDAENIAARKGLTKTNKILQLNSSNNTLLDPGIDDMIEKAEEKINCGEIDEAKAILAEVMNIDKYHLDALNDLSVCSIIDENIEKANELIAMILTIDPNNEIAVENITLINQRTSEVIAE